MEPSQNDFITSEILLDYFQEENIAEETSICAVEEEIVSLDNVSKTLSQLNLEAKNVVISKNETSSPKNSTYENDTSSTMWISCVRCGKKNEIDCNFCGKCGLQIHKKVSIVEPEAEENLSPEVSRNIKYHYKRPVFCFGPRGNMIDSSDSISNVNLYLGNCFASFSSPSKSVRNVSKFQLSALSEFRESLTLLRKCKIIATELPKTWGEKELKSSEWCQVDSILKDIAIMIANKTSFTLDEPLRNNLREYFAGISPKDLGSIKMLATQDNVSYLRGEIDQIFHLLVIGKTMEACELSIKFNYWDHALIIAKTLDISFYETVMNRFLDSRFASGHPLRILYLIMTNNENSACKLPNSFIISYFLFLVEEIRNMINNTEMPLFVQEIWTILINFLLRAKHESLIISKIFEDIAKCLFERNFFENSLVCFIISVLSGTKSPNHDILDKIDYLLSWFSSKESIDTINFASIHILNVFNDKIETIPSGSIMWRCQFTRLIYAQFLHDLGVFDVEALNRLKLALDYSKKAPKCGFTSFLTEESSVLEARNLVKIDTKQPSPKVKTVEHKPVGDHSYNTSNFSPKNIPHNSGFEPLSGSYSPLDLGPQEFSPTSGKLESPGTSAGKFPQFDNNDIISNSAPLSSLNNHHFNPSSTEMVAQSPKSPAPDVDKSSIAKEKESDAGGNVFGKLKSWFPVSKSGANQENQKQITKAKMGKPNSFRYDEKLKKWVDDNDPSASEQAPKLPPPPTIGVTPFSNGQNLNDNAAINFRAKKGKVKYFDPLNPDGPSSTQLQPSVPNFD